MKRILYWFRNDLRLHDNEGFFRAVQDAEAVIPVYCVDPRHTRELTAIGRPKTGPFRAQFLQESLDDLRHRLREKGGELVILRGNPEVVLPEMAREYQVDAIYASKEVTQEETNAESALSKALKSLNVDIEFFWGSTLYHVRDLPFPIARLDDIFTAFRTKLEKNTPIRPTFPEPESITLAPGLRTTGSEQLTEPGEPTETDPRTAIRLRGGETAGLERLRAYLWDRDALRTYKETRNGLLGEDFSSKFSAWLALGCLSPRRIYEEVKRYEAERVANESTYWLIFELLWRDYFRFVALKYGTRLFKPTGIRHRLDVSFLHDRDLFERWAAGETGVPFIDAAMREMKQTGFLSNRARQNVASFMVHDLKLDWTWGAAYFESQLVDYDVCSNWGNWCYVAGVGNDPRENRYFNIYSQAVRYDPEGAYVKHWLPELSRVPAERVHSVWSLTSAEQAQYGVVLGKDYPLPIIRADAWLKSERVR